MSNPMAENESFVERINGRAEKGQPVFATIQGVRVSCTYVRPMEAKQHRCVVMWKDDTRKRYCTVSTRKVSFA